MDLKELKELIATGEGLTLEFKESLPSDLGSTICSFANAIGGKVILGVTDKGAIKGFELTNKLKSQIQDIARNIDPSISVEVNGAENVVVIEVPEGQDKPYQVSGKFYVRTGASTQQLKRDEVRSFFEKEGHILFDEQVNSKFDLNKDLSSIKVQTFLKKSNITSKAAITDILENLSVVENKKVKNAGVLLFCEDIRPFIVWATVTCVLFQGTNKVTILDRKEFTQDVISNFEGAISYLKQKLNTNYIIGMYREEKLELPEDALREALINAIVHRNYHISTHIQIDIFQDRVEISNPGNLAAGLTKADLGKKSFSRNPLLMDLFLRMKFVERAGSGIIRMREAMKTYNLELQFDVTNTFFTVIFKRPDVNKIPEKSQINPRKVPDKYQKLIAEIVAQPTISRNDLADKLKESADTVQSKLRKLIKDGIIKRVGPAKGGHWEVLK